MSAAANAQALKSVTYLGIHKAQRVHVVIRHILWPEGGYHIMTLGSMYVL